MSSTTYLVTYWDTEDYLSPPDAGSDDIILHVARSARAAGLRACFHIIGEKVRSLVGRRRMDIIEEIAKHHDVSSHYNYGSVHPTTCELVAECGWDDGVASALARERPAFRLIEEAFGRCAALSRHGSQEAPQIIRACAVEGKAFWDGLVRVPGAPVFWYCDALVFHAEPSYCLDGMYQEDTEFEPALARVVNALEACARDPEHALVAFFGHPHRIICEEFADVSYYHGKNALWEDVRPPKPLSDSEREVVRRNVVRMFEALARIPGLTATTVTELRERFGRQASEFTSADLRDLATRVVEGGAPAYTEVMSAGEGVLALATALVERRGAGRAPETVLRMPVLGPLSIPRENPQADRLDWHEVVDLGQIVLEHSRRTGHLPAQLVSRGGEVGLGSAMVALAEAYLAPEPGTSVALRPSPPWPPVAEGMPRELGYIPQWVCHDPAMDVSRIVYWSQLMSWTIKPAGER